MRVTLVNPPIVSQKGDLSGSGIPYMPIGLAYLASALRAVGHDVVVVDAFGAAPHRIRATRDQYIQGLTPAETAAAVPDGTDVVALYAQLAVAHGVLLEIAAAIRRRLPSARMVALENADKVTSYSLRRVAPELFASGIDFIVLGYLERRTIRLLRGLDAGSAAPVDGVIARTMPGIVVPPEDGAAGDNLDRLPIPAWELFPLEGYWSVGYAHAPLASARYLPLLTSRGCPYNCGFCCIPEISGRRWRARSAAGVVDEMAALHARFGVREFHVEDLNPTLDRRRMLDICARIRDRGLDVTWKLAQGTKLESLDAEVLGAMAAAGCTYVSISPESGSARVLALMDKPVDRDASVALVRVMRGLGIASQACFVLGYPGETSADRRETAHLVRRLARAGLDEVALFVAAPTPGARIAGSGAFPAVPVAATTFTPRWRADFAELAAARKRIYAQYVLVKALHHPLGLWRYLRALATGRFVTKVEMTIFRKLSVAWHARAGALVGPRLTPR